MLFSVLSIVLTCLVQGSITVQQCTLKNKQNCKLSFEIVAKNEHIHSKHRFLISTLRKNLYKVISKCETNNFNANTRLKRISSVGSNSAGSFNSSKDHNGHGNNKVQCISKLMDFDTELYYIDYDNVTCQIPELTLNFDIIQCDPTSENIKIMNQCIESMEQRGNPNSLRMINVCVMRFHFPVFFGLCLCCFRIFCFFIFCV